MSYIRECLGDSLDTSDFLATLTTKQQALYKKAYTEKAFGLFFQPDWQISASAGIKLRVDLGNFEVGVQLSLEGTYKPHSLKVITFNKMKLVFNTPEEHSSIKYYSDHQICGAITPLLNAYAYQVGATYNDHHKLFIDECDFIEDGQVIIDTILTLNFQGQLL